MATTQQTLTDIEGDLVSQYVTKEGSTINTRETDDGAVEEQCHQCGNWYKRIGTHWAKSSCQHPPISEKKWEMCKGLMMGDGNLGKRNEKNSRLEVSNTNVTFLQYLEHEFGWLASLLYLNQTAQERADHLNECGIDGDICNTDVKDCVDVYGLRTRSHIVFNHFEQWWETGEKVFPQIEYTKPLLRMWWLSDGCFNWKTPSSCNILFTSVKEGKRPENIFQSFANCGFDCSLQGDYTFALPVSQTEDFFDYIGHDPVPGFEYKWAWQDRDRYDRLKEQTREKHCTQTLE